MLKIGDFSKLSRISIRMLRHYDEIGLLVPKTTDTFTGYRYYAEDQLPIAGRIASLRDMGFSLTAVSEILNCYNDPQALDYGGRVEHPGAGKLNNGGAKIEHLRRRGCTLTA